MSLCYISNDLIGLKRLLQLNQGFKYMSRKFIPKLSDSYQNRGLTD